MAKFANPTRPSTDGSAAAPRLGSVQTSVASGREHVTSRISSVASSNRRVIVVATHVILAAVAYLTAFLLRFDFHLPATVIGQLAQTLPYVVLLRVVTLECFGVHRGSWRHVGSRDLVALSVATTASSSLSGAEAIDGCARAGVGWMQRQASTAFLWRGAGFHSYRSNRGGVSEHR